MSEAPRHVHEASALWWDIVDGLRGNGFPEEQAYNVVNEFFKQFKPLPRSQVQSLTSKAINNE